MKRIFAILLFTALLLTSCVTPSGDVSNDISVLEESLGEVSGEETTVTFADIGISGLNLHMQGFTVDATEQCVYWSFTDTIVKTDMGGNLLGKVSFTDGHLGDLEFVDGKIYGTLLGQPNQGDVWDAWTGHYVVVYDKYLTRLSKTSLDNITDMATGKADNPCGVYAIDGIAYGNNPDGEKSIFIAGGTRIAEENTKQVIFEYSLSLEYKTQYVYETGNTPYGIQSLAYDNDTGNLWFTTYGPSESYQAENTTYRVKSDFSDIDIENNFSSPYGLAYLGNGLYFISADGVADDESKAGYAFVAELDGSGRFARKHAGYPEAINISKIGGTSAQPPSSDLEKIVDISGNGFDLTAENITLITDRSDAVLISDNSKLYCKSDNLSTIYKDSGTASISLWVNPSELAGDYVYVGGLQNVDGNYALNLEYCWGESVLRLWQSNKDYSDTIYCGKVKLNEWTHYLLTLSGNQANIYINGELAGSLSVSSDFILNDVRHISFGEVKVEAPYDKGRKGFIGMLDDITIYDKVLNGNDAKQLYAGNRVGYAPVAEYDFSSEGNGSAGDVPRQETNGFSLWTENWRKNVLKSELVPISAPTAVTISAARNDTEAFQICCRSSVNGEVLSIKLSDLKGQGGTISASNASARTVGYYKVLENTFELSNPIAAAPAMFPEKLLNSDKCEITLFETQPFWISYYIPEDAVPGDYNGKATVSTTFGDYEIDINLKVYDTIIPKASKGEFSLELWNQYVKCFEDVSKDLDVIEKAYGVPAYSEEWWTLMEIYAEFMKQNRMNVLFLNVIDLLKDAEGTSVSSDGKVTYDWSLLDRFVELFLEKGEIKLISAEHLCAQSVRSDGLKSYKIEIITSDGGKNYKSYLPVEDGEAYLIDYLHQLNDHLNEKDWTDKWIQHIGDEPTNDLMPKNYTKISNLVRSICNGVKTGDAFYGENASEFNDAMDIWIPITALYETQQEFFNDKKAGGDDLWLYTAGYPGELYLNRFIDTQLYKSELLSWYCFKNGANGYLHWGLMEWYVWEDFDNDDTTVGSHNLKYNGDSWCIYPDKENMSVISSIRIEALREAAEDYELLALLAAKDKNAATELVNAMITDGTNYETNIYKISSLREQLLEELTK